MMEKYPRAINLAKINFGNALFFRGGDERTTARSKFIIARNNATK